MARWEFTYNGVTRVTEVTPEGTRTRTVPVAEEALRRLQEQAKRRRKIQQETEELEDNMFDEIQGLM
jgi:site-specific recombinase XerC